MPDNRELAALIACVASAVAVLAWPKSRKSAVAVLRMICCSKLTVVWVGAVFWLSIGVFLLARLGAWDVGDLKDTVIWCIFGGILIAFQGIRAADPTREFKTLVTEQFKFSMFFELVMNAYPLSLMSELLLIVVFGSLSALVAVAEIRPEYSGARKLFSSVLAALVLALVALTTWHFYQRPEEVFSAAGIKDLCLPIYLTLLVVPYAYLVSLYAGYESLFSMRLANHANMPAAVRRYAKRQLIWTCRTNANRTRRAQALLSPELRWADTRQKVDDEIGRLREELTRRGAQ